MCKVVRITLSHVQTDGWNCGVWVYVVLNLFIQYMGGAQFGQRGFATLFHQHPQFTQLARLRGAELEAATERNEAFIESERSDGRAVADSSISSLVSPTVAYLVIVRTLQYARSQCRARAGIADRSACRPPRLRR